MLGILAYPRTGSTLVYEVIKQHYRGYPNIRCLGEVFNPFEYQKIIIHKDKLLMVNYDAPLPANRVQRREERFDLFRNHVKDGYIIKVFPQDLRYDPIFELIKTYYRQLIIMDRKDIIDTILSALVAMEHRRFNADNDRYEYQKFEAKIFEVEWLCYLYNQYGSFVNKLIPNTKTRLYYEDVIGMNRKEIIKACGLIPNSNDEGPLPLTKLLNKEEKLKLITNIGDVLRTISSTIVLDNLDITGYHLG